MTREFAAGCYATWWSDRAITHFYLAVSCIAVAISPVRSTARKPLVRADLSSLWSFDRTLCLTPNSADIAQGAYQRTIGPNGLPALLRRAGDCTVAPIRAIASFLRGWAAVKRSGANRFGYSAGAFRVLCHAFRCCDSIAVPIFPLFSPPGCSINPSKSVVERPIPAAPSARARRPPTLGQFRSVSR